MVFHCFSVMALADFPITIMKIGISGADASRIPPEIGSLGKIAQTIRRGVKSAKKICGIYWL